MTISPKATTYGGKVFLYVRYTLSSIVCEVLYFWPFRAVVLSFFFVPLVLRNLCSDRNRVDPCRYSLDPLKFCTCAHGTVSTHAQNAFGTKTEPVNVLM